MRNRIIPTAEPFFFPGGEIGVLLVHGFTGTPKEMRWMGEYLAEKGYSVLGVRLAGHATNPKDMKHVKWQDWLTSVEDGYHLLRDSTQKIVVAGLSMGGVLSLLFASHFETPDRLSAVIAMSTPYELPSDPRLRFVRQLHWLFPNAPKGESDWHDHSAESVHVDYPNYPTIAIAELRDLVDEMRSRLGHVKIPVLLMHATEDGSVDPQNMEKLFTGVGSQEKRMFWVEQSGHVITRDKERESVFQAAHKFIQEITGKSG